jgi:hypothetical protein
MDCLEETVDVITDCPASLPDVSPVEFLWAMLQKLLRRMTRQTLQELKGMLLDP